MSARLRDLRKPRFGSYPVPRRRVEGDLYEYAGIKFMLGTELSCVARVGGRGRRVHILAYAPDIRTAPALWDSTTQRMVADGHAICVMPERSAVLTGLVTRPVEDMDRHAMLRLFPVLR